MLSHPRRATMNSQYEKRQRIGTGGMATVYAGWDAKLERPVAIKEPRLPVELEDTAPAALELFLEEARKLALVRHPNVLEIYDVETDHQPPRMIMELAEGSLDSQLKRHPNRPLADGMAIFRQLVAGLAEIHTHGLVHRDIKPLNILRCGELYKIADFGIAKRLGERSQPYLTKKYAAPEVHLCEPTTMAADVYSLGLLGHELLLGTTGLNKQVRAGLRSGTGASEPADDRDSDTLPWHVWHTVTTMTLPALDTLIDLPSPVAQILARMVRKRPGERYPSCIAVRDALAALDTPGRPAHEPAADDRTEPVPEPLVDDDAPTAPFVDDDSEPVSEPMPFVSVPAAPAPRDHDRRRVALAVVGVALIAATVAWAFASLRDGRTTNDLSVLRQDGMAALEAGDFAAAVDHLEALLGQAPDDADAALGCAKAHYHLTNYGQASALLDDVARARPDHPEPPLYAGLIDLARDRVPSAIQNLERAVALGDGDQDARFYLGYAYYKQGNYPQARTALETFLRTQDDQNPLRDRARGFLQKINRQGDTAIQQRAPPPRQSIYQRRFTLDGFRRTSTRLDAFRGQVLILHLWASWCHPCQEEMPHLVRFAERDFPPLQARGLALVTISNDFVAAELARYVDRHLPARAASLPIFWDPDARLNDRLELGTTLPQTLVIGRDGQVLARTVGIVRWQDPPVLAAARAVPLTISQRPSVQRTRPGWRVVRSSPRLRPGGAPRRRSRQ